MNTNLGQSDFEDLTAYLDGELDADRRQIVEDLIRTDPAWGDQCDRLRAVDGLLDAYDLPAAPSDLTDRILRGMRFDRTADFVDLSAHADGQLDAERAAAVEELIRTDAVWGNQWNRLEAVDRALDAYDVPAPPAGLTGRVLAGVYYRVRGRKLVFRLLVPLAGAAAAAAIILVALIVGSGEATSPASNGPQLVEKNPVSQPDDVEQAIIEHLDMVRDLNVLENYETLEAIERLELASLGT